MQSTLKHYSEADIKNIYKLLEDVYTTSDTMSERFSEKFPDEKSCSRYFSEITNLPGSVVLIAETDGELAGYITIKQRYQGNLRHTSELNMGVHSKFRGQGVGKDLLLNALNQVEAANKIEIIYLIVRADNTPAIKLYKNFGFGKIVLLKRDTKVGDTYYDGIMMSKFM